MISKHLLATLVKRSHRLGVNLDPTVLSSAKYTFKTLKRYVDIKPGMEGKVLSLIAISLQQTHNKARPHWT